MHKSLIASHAAALERPLPPPPCPILDAHMHVGPVETDGDYVRAAEMYGVRHAVALLHGVEPEELLDRYGSFFIPCAWGRMPTRRDAYPWTRDEVRRVETLWDRGVRLLKYKVEPSKGRPEAFLDDSRLAPVLERAESLEFALILHIAQPSRWWPDRYDPNEVGTKESYYVQVEHLLERYPGLDVVGAHMGGYPERLDLLTRWLARYPNLYLDTSATKWVVRELGRQQAEARDFFLRHADRILFGSDLVVMFGDSFDYYTSRFHVQRTLWESSVHQPSMIFDPDATAPDFPDGAEIRPLALPEATLRQIYWENACRLFLP